MMELMSCIFYSCEGNEMADFSKMLTDLGVNMGLHEELIQSLSRLHEKTHLSQTNRPETMRLFDEAFHESHGKRVAQIKEHRNNGGKSIGTFCIYVPDEIAYAADVITIPLCGGSGWAVPYADKMLPRDICPLIRSTFGMAVSGTCPFKKFKDLAVGETTCDAKKKAWDLFGFKVMEVPQKKTPLDRALWLGEVREFHRMMETLSGTKITKEKLRDGISLLNRKRKALQRINAFRILPNPPLSGLDALLVSQVALSQDIHEFIRNAEALAQELEQRVASGISAYKAGGKRILIAGSPSPLGYAKLHHIVESAGFHIVADESCTGTRYFRDLVEEEDGDMDSMILALADRYMKIDCSCFSPNTERLDNLLTLIHEFNVQAVIHHILQYCHGYNIEARFLEKELKKRGIPSLIVETDYSEEDTGQIKTRVEAFSEILDQKS